MMDLIIIEGDWVTTCIGHPSCNFIGFEVARLERREMERYMHDGQPDTKEPEQAAEDREPQMGHAERSAKSMHGQPYDSQSLAHIAK